MNINRYFSDRELTCNDMNPILLEKLYCLRQYVDRKIFIHSGYRAGDTGLHGQKKAFDIHIEGLSVVDQYLVAERFNFNGIGVYPYWNRPGLHVDVRFRHARWGKSEKGLYVRLDNLFLKEVINI